MSPQCDESCGALYVQRLHAGVPAWRSCNVSFQQNASFKAEPVSTQHQFLPSTPRTTFLLPSPRPSLFFLQLRGRRRVLLLPPTHSFPALAPFPVLHPYDCYSQPGLCYSLAMETPGVDVERAQALMYERWPEFFKQVRSYCCLCMDLRTACGRSPSTHKCPVCLLPYVIVCFSLGRN